MDQYNLFKGLNSNIDEEISKIQFEKPQRKQKKTKKDKKQKEHSVSVWNSSFFNPPTTQKSSSSEQSKNITTSHALENLNIGSLKKDKLFEVMKNVMLQFLYKKKLSIIRLEYLIENLDSRHITKKTMKDKIMFFSTLLSIPIKHNKKTVNFESQSRTVTESFYNLKDTRALKKFFLERTEILFNTINTDLSKEEEKYLFYCILASVKFCYPNLITPNLIPYKYKCSTFSNIYEVVQPKTYAGIVDFVQKVFPSIVFIIQEVGYSKFKEKRRYTRYLFMNEKQESIVDILNNQDIPKIYLRKIASVIPEISLWRLLASSKSEVVLPIGDEIEICVK